MKLVGCMASLCSHHPCTELLPAGIEFSYSLGKGIKQSIIEETDFEIKTVVIDPGHGGHDPGCLGGSSLEKHIALAVGQQLAWHMKKRFPALRVIMTRDKDVFIPLHERGCHSQPQRCRPVHIHSLQFHAGLCCHPRV